MSLDELLEAKPIRWLFELWEARRAPTVDEIAMWFTDEYQWGEGMVDALNRMGSLLDPVPPHDVVVDGRLRVRFGPAGQATPRFRLILGVEEGGARIDHFDWGILELEGVQLNALPCDELTPAQRAELHELFDATYENANHPYLDESLARLRNVALGHSEARLVGFGISETRMVELPRIGSSMVSLLGLACIDPGHRRQGLAGRLETMAVSNTEGIPVTSRRLATTRAAHPATFRMFRHAGVVPPIDGGSINDFHREVGAVIAGLFGADFDGEHFVCRGRGIPVGTPRLDIDVEPEEWKPFIHVDRSRGDTLLAMRWSPDSPDGW